MIKSYEQPRQGDAIEITSEVISAGVSEFDGHSEVYDSRPLLCRAIYLAMETSRRRSSRGVEPI